jgi:hypothetical protein
MADYVTVAELRSALGIGSLYTDATLEQACTASTDVIKGQLWFNDYPIVGVGTYQNVSFVVISANPSFTTGQTVTITNTGAPYDGTHTITGTYPWTAGSSSMPWYPYWPYSRAQFPYGYSIIQFSVSHADDAYHLTVPYGKVAVSVPTGIDYSAAPLIREAALEIAIDIWQSRQQSNAGGVSPDGTQSPYRMGNTLLARVRGLLSPYLSPRGMVG